MADGIIHSDKWLTKYTKAIHKAINSLEEPIKEKHVRSAIIGTFEEQGAQTFWMLALRLPYMEDRIMAWKLCHVVHKILREGHPLCLDHSLRHRRELEESWKLWCHLKEGYGKMIRLYTILLLTKLDFHKRNPRFPGNLRVTKEELESIGANDINNYFQLFVDMFDYLDTILQLQAAVFGSLDMSRSNSMTSAGECRLAPLNMCLQDASRLYDYCVKILFQLHLSLPAYVLNGHRDRFLKQFKELKQFYQDANKLPYFRNLIIVPPLPERPPNFHLQTELNTPSQRSLLPIQTQEHLQAHIDAIKGRDNQIKHLQYELERLRNDINMLTKNHLEYIKNLHEQIAWLKTSLATAENQLLQERQIKEKLFQQVSSVTQT